MKIAYGVHGYGRGHATRALAIVPELRKRHEVLVLAGSDACRALGPHFPVVRVPTLRYHHIRPGKRSTLLTLWRNTPGVLDLLMGGPGVGMVRDALEAFGPDVVLCDSESWTHRAARDLGLPRISVDHFGVLVYCAWPMSPVQRAKNAFEGCVYRTLMARPERMVIVSFFRPPPKREGVTVVGPVLRQEVRETETTSGDHLLVYFSSGERYFTPHVELALRSLVDVPVRVYGVGREGTDANLTFKPLGNRPFIDDLASCRAVVSTAGNQLISEAMHFGKPLMVLPEDSLEQRLNAETVERLGYGVRSSIHAFSTRRVQAFLEAGDRYAANIRAAATDGLAEAVEAIERYAAELTGDER